MNCANGRTAPPEPDLKRKVSAPFGASHFPEKPGSLNDPTVFARMLWFSCYTSLFASVSAIKDHIS